MKASAKESQPQGSQVDMGGHGDFVALLEFLAAVRDATLRGPLSAVVDRTDHKGISDSVKVRISDGAGRWRVEDDDGSIAFDPIAGLVTRAGGIVEMIGHERPDWLPDEVRLFYPLTMRIWGGHQDDQRITGAERTQNGIRLSMVYLEDENFSAEAMFDPEHGVVTDFRTATHRLSVRELQSDIGGGT
ncbi:hypothetical protein ACWF5H_15450 [Arthrobacter sp. NPDC055138]